MTTDKCVLCQKKTKMQAYVCMHIVHWTCGICAQMFLCNLHPALGHGHWITLPMLALCIVHGCNVHCGFGCRYCVHS